MYWVLRNLSRGGWYMALVMGLLLSGGCRQDMHDQPRYEPLEASQFFADGRSARPLVPGTVARGHLQTDTALFTGKVNGALVESLPIPVTRALVERGRERYGIYCVPCHDRVGNGEGIVVQRGFRHPPSLHADPLRTAPIGHFFDVMSHGFGAMASYAVPLTVHDRWAIAAYIRALQLSQHATLEDVPDDVRQRLQEQKP